MGKYMKKPKTTRDVAVMDASQSSLGVRTRAKTLALQRTATAAADYLELRSRRLEKPPLSRKSSPAATKQGLVVCRDDKEKPQIESPSPNQKAASSESVGLPIERRNEGFEIGDLEIEASFGENNLELDARERSTRESTPCSSIRAPETVTTPGSSTKQRNPSERAENPLLRNIPTAREMEEFFADAELPQQRQFIEKYNFDIVNDMPLPGRYEWVKVMP